MRRIDPPSYPNLLRFLALSSVPTVPTEMTFAVTRDRGAFEWAGDTIFTVFCQPQNLIRAAHWRMIWDVLRFNACAKKLVEDDDEGSGKNENGIDLYISIGDYLVKEGYSDSFRDDYLIVSPNSLSKSFRREIDASVANDSCDLVNTA